jgi:L-serine dehydratase
LPKTFLPFHPNALKLDAYGSDGKEIASQTVYSVGGGKISDGIKTIGITGNEGKISIR